MISLLFRGSFFHIFHFVFLKDTFCSIFFPSSSLADMPPSIFFTSFLIYCYISFKFSFYPYLFADIFSPFSLCLSLFAYIFSSFSFYTFLSFPFRHSLLANTFYFLFFSYFFIANTFFFNIFSSSFLVNTFSSISLLSNTILPFSFRLSLHIPMTFDFS
ncbi:unnamed protein product [Acanthosepion pharaonis]|uniref:Uncharacterized protein n=1 Tax=Acanthosepion pharaonis TaxID=158019 RepID=A0A812B6W3_ACAPH|nr:unnamed protein product [Sepia pharaonis]